MDVRANDFLQGLLQSGPAGLLVIVIAVAGLCHNVYAVLVPQRKAWVLVIVACFVPLLVAAIFAYCRVHAAYDAFDAHDFRLHMSAVAVSRAVLLTVAMISGCAAALGCWAVARYRHLPATRSTVAWRE